MKLAVIGGGSTYTPELIDGVIKRHSRLPITHIHLVDIDPTKLGIIAAFAKRMIAAAQLDIEIEHGTDLRAGVRGASFVVSQFRVGLKPQDIVMSYWDVNTVWLDKKLLVLEALLKHCEQFQSLSM
jgi:alpha-galactosidase/6-phospho-beta-glucosidase family protein